MPSHPRGPDLRLAAWCEVSLASLTSLEGKTVEEFVEPGLGPSRAIALTLRNGREAMLVERVWLPNFIEFWIDYERTAFHGEDLALLCDAAQLDLALVNRYTGTLLWC